MKARHILFSAPMVRALLAGRKTQTRRTVKGLRWIAETAPGVEPYWFMPDHPRAAASGGGPFGPHHAHLCPYGVPGDLLWVRETHAIVGNVDPGWTIYRASGYESECKRHGFDGPPPESEITWRPSIFMPRWASRLTLRIIEIRVERLQDIGEADARAEGVLYVPGHGDITPGELQADPGYSNYLNCRMGFEALWKSINGDGSWTANPWCWALTFEVIKANVDAVMRRAA